MRISVHIRYSAVLLAALFLFAAGFLIGYNAGHRDGISHAKALQAIQER
jgi:hypothetical protein